METLKEVELVLVSGFSRALLVSFCRLKFLALSNVDLDVESDVGVKWNLDSVGIGLEDVYLRGTSLKALTKTLSSTDVTALRKLALTPTFEVGFSEAVAEADHGAWLADYELRMVAFHSFPFLPWNNQPVHSSVPPLRVYSKVMR